MRPSNIFKRRSHNWTVKDNAARHKKAEICITAARTLTASPSGRGIRVPLRRKIACCSFEVPHRQQLLTGKSGTADCGLACATSFIYSYFIWTRRTTALVKSTGSWRSAERYAPSMFLPPASFLWWKRILSLQGRVII